MRYLALLSFLTITACNNSNVEKQQAQIDSLTNIVKQKEDSTARVEKERKEKEEKKKKEKGLSDIRNSVLSKVTTDKPHFTTISLGGLKDISFALFNDYNYKLEQVVIKVYYLKTNMNEIKNETIIIKDFAPNSRQQLTAPDYIRAGSYINVRISSVTCKAINLCYEGFEGIVSEGIATTAVTPTVTDIELYDPYKCKN